MKHIGTASTQKSLHTCSLCLHKWRVPHFALKYPCNPPGDRHLATPPPTRETTARANQGVCKGGGGTHSTTFGWHQLCLTPPLHGVLDCCSLCQECVSTRSGPGSRLANPDYTPSRASTEASATSISTFNSNSTSSSNFDFGSSSDFDSVSECDFDSVFDPDSNSDSDSDCKYDSD